MENTKNCDRLRYPLYIVHDNFDDDGGGGSIESTSWMEDDELGRGYLLISTSAGLGKLYRWETGGVCMCVFAVYCDTRRIVLRLPYIFPTARKHSSIIIS